MEILSLMAKEQKGAAPELSLRTKEQIRINRRKKELEGIKGKNAFEEKKIGRGEEKVQRSSIKGKGVRQRRNKEAWIHTRIII